MGIHRTTKNDERSSKRDTRKEVEGLGFRSVHTSAGCGHLYILPGNKITNVQGFIECHYHAFTLA